MDKNKYRLFGMFGCILCGLAALTIAASFESQRRSNNVLFGQPERHRQNENTKAKHDSFIGFTAWSQSNQLTRAGEIVTFDGLSLNEGGHYNVTTNTFTCPQDGVYFVTMTARGTDQASVWVYIKKEDEYLVEIVSDIAAMSENIVSNSVLFECGTGERVYVEGGRPGSLYGETGSAHTTFTVWFVGEMAVSNLQHSSFTGFCAIGSPSPQFPRTGEPVMFGEVLVNGGNHYNPEQSKFTCPEDGTYFVAVTYYKYLDDLVLGVQKSSFIILHSEDRFNLYNQVSNWRLFHCNAGDQVLVTATDDSVIDNTPLRSSFSVLQMAPHGSESSKHEGIIGFTAWKQVDQEYSSGDVISFEGVLLNEGNGYNHSTSTFTCPNSGIYFVSVTFKKRNNEPLMVGVEYQSTYVLKSEETSNNPWNIVSNACLVRCFAGEEIKVRASDSGAISGDFSKSHNTFTVIFLYIY